MLTESIIKEAQPKEKQYKLSEGDGKGLCLLVCPNGSKQWRYRYRFEGKAKMISLGSYPDVSLEEARKKLAEVRAIKASGKDPSKHRQEVKRELIAKHENTFEKIAREWHGMQQWSEGHARDVLQRLESNLFPLLGSRPIKDIKPLDLLAALRKIEERGALDIAKRCCQMSGQIFRYAVITGRAEHDIAANLRGALQSRKAVGYKHLEPHELNEFLGKLAKYDGDLLTQLAIRFLLLTFVRTGELRGARWEEFHWGQKYWLIPGERMKMGEKHIVPLSRQTLELLEHIQKISGDTPFLFPNVNNPQKTMSENTILYALYRMGYHSRATGHGFRATASTALNEMRFDEDHIEIQLAHAERNKSRAPYNYAQYLPEREYMMQHWADFLDAVRQEGSTVTTKDFRVRTYQYEPLRA